MALSLATLALGAPRPAQAHSYNLATGYSFTLNQGLSLSGTLSSLSSYAIDMVFSLTGNNRPRGNGFQKLIDFKGLTADAGLYDHSGSLNFFTDSGAEGTTVFTANQTVDVLLTRDGDTNLVTADVNSVQQFQFTDTGATAVFASNSTEFFHDDAVTGNESATGLVRSITVNSAPEPSSVTALALAGLQGLSGQTTGRLARPVVVPAGCS